jgi:predicted pyridoxine 5'-phosphate oxidase superfamily flavin-nucleotide-binding protein
MSIANPLVVLGSVSVSQNVWASILFGSPGFMTAVDQSTVEFDLNQAVCNSLDPFWTNIEHHPQIGMLVIELATRRRLRINGQVTRLSETKLHLNVSESYPNCPKYIQRRHITRNQKSTSHLKEPQMGRSLLPEQQTFIATADTFFVASAHPTRGVDASHRGGNPGFVRVLDDRTLRIPDYAGNSMFNTLGNFVENPHAGLIFLDFERDMSVQIIGRPEILWELDDPTHEINGTRRYWTLFVEQWLESSLPQSFRWELLDYSPYNPS